MTIDGTLYRAAKGIGGYARLTASDEELAQAEVEQVLRNRRAGEPGLVGRQSAILADLFSTMQQNCCNQPSDVKDTETCLIQQTKVSS